MIVIELRGKVVPKATPQFAVRHNRAMAYIPEAQRVYHEALRYAAQQAMEGRPPLEGPVMLDLTVYLMPQKYMSKRRRREAIAGIRLPITRPDLSNYVKMIEDAFTHVVWVDDNQVVSIAARKRFGEIPGIRAEIEEVRS